MMPSLPAALLCSCGTTPFCRLLPVLQQRASGPTYPARNPPPSVPAPQTRRHVNSPRCPPMHLRKIQDPETASPPTCRAVGVGVRNCKLAFGRLRRRRDEFALPWVALKHAVSNVFMHCLGKLVIKSLSGGSGCPTDTREFAG